MCGISGLIHKARTRPVDGRDLSAMANQLAHRGPDDEGRFMDEGVGLSFRRLSIIDLSPAGHQPMTTPDGCLTLVCNGAIFNHLDLRKELLAEGFKFQSNSDVEVILHGYAHWGLDVLDHLDGMFAFALWDAGKKRLLLVRDRLGIKPLCYYEDDDRFAFASELPGLLAIPGLDRELNPGAVWNYLSEMQVPAPQTMFRRIRKLLPGHAMLLSWDHDEHFLSRTWRYWELPPPALSSPETFLDTARELRRLIENAVRTHLMADVPVGVFLSGGLDSSIVAALVSHLTKEPVQTFSAAFPGFEGMDESAHQQVMVDRLRSRHHVFNADSSAVSSNRELVRRSGEPWAVLSALPLLGVSRLASETVKVILSGDGSDEVLAGYGDRYFTPRSWSVFDRLPLPRSLFSSLHGVIAAAGGRFHRGRDLYGRLRKHLWDGSQTQEQRRRERRTAGFSTGEKLALVSDQWLESDAEAGEAIYQAAWEVARSAASGDGLDSQLYFEMSTVLPDEMLRKVDLCSSCVGLEARVPFMDRAVVEYAATIPLAYKLRDGVGKQVLKAACEDLLPPGILFRRKQGFNVPLGNWMEAVDFRPLAEARLPFVRRGAIQDMLDREDRGENWSYPLWILEAYRVWVEEFGISS